MNTVGSADKLHRETCPFCDRTAFVLENGLAYAVFDLYPVNEGHLLVVPKRHYADFFDSTKEEIHAITALLREGRQLLDRRYGPEGYNIGVNCGISSGQTIMHVHVHLIPRYTGDVDDPTGGVRGVIPARQKYPTSRGT